MHFYQFIVLIVFLGFLGKGQFSSIDDFFIPEDGEIISVFEDFNNDLSDEKPFLMTSPTLAIKKSICLKKTNQRTIERILSVETPPPKNIWI